MTVRPLVLRAVLGVTCAYHLGIGLVACLTPGLTLQVAAWLYDVQVETVGAQLAILLKALGAYALFTGGLLLLALRDPQRYRHLVVACAGLLLLRAATRLLCADLLEQAFAVSFGRNLLHVGVLGAQTGLMLWGLGPRGAPRAPKRPGGDSQQGYEAACERS